MSKSKFRHIFAGTAAVLFVTALLFAFNAMSVKAWNGAIATEFAGGDGSEGSPYEISSAEELAYFAQVINDGTEGNYESAYYKLTEDVVLNDTLEDTLNEWTAIGSSEHPFMGSFDGNGKTIKGIYINKPDESYQGLFGYSQGMIKNVGVINSSINGAKYVGSICGYNYGGTISNCYNEGTVSGSSCVGGVCGYNKNRDAISGTISGSYNAGSVSGTGNYVGGVCGYKNSGKIIDCYNTGDVSGASYVGGVCGYSYDAISGCYNTGSVSGTGTYVGGVCGYNYRGTMINCYNTGFVSGTEQVGGVCGYGKGTIKSCYNTGTVSGTNNIGGVCGYSESSYGKIINCYNTGTVSGTNNIGGVCGYNYDYSTISNCYSASSVSGTGTNIGGVCVCGSNSATVNNCYYNNNLCSKNNSIGTGKSTEELCGELSVLGFDDTVWEKGSCTVSEIDSTGVFSVQYTLPHLKAMKTEPVSDTIKIYNFGTASSPKWLSCTPIYTAEELQAINELLSNNYVLMNDITLEEGENNFTAIGTADAPFSGYFSGNRHVVSGININCTKNYQGLFGYSKGVIKGVGVINSSINGAQYVGGVCGYNYGGTISNCYNTSTVSGASYVGGVCGYIYNYGTISNCNNTGSVSVTGNYVGGVCGYKYTGTITGCYNAGAVRGKLSYVGGVCGYSSGTISVCYNTGTVSGTNNIGGVCGYKSSGKISNCYNTESVSGTEKVGGVCGYNKGTISSCYCTSSVSGTSSFGGVCGYNDGGTVNNCYFNNYFCAKDNCGGISKTTEELCAELSVLGFDDTVWEKGSCTTLSEGSDDIISIKYSLPSLKRFNAEPASLTVKMFNFGTDTEEKWLPCIQIYTAEELQAINKLLSNNYVLMNDITLEKGENNFTAIGTKDAPFSGYFSGNGHVVSGIDIECTNDNQGLFGYSKGVIKDVGVIKSYIRGSGFSGGVCGYNYGGTISGCYNTGTVSGSHAGGVCGKNTGKISDCYNSGSVYGTYAGGVCGINSGTISNCYNTDMVWGSSNCAGGVCGDNKDGTVSKCYYNKYLCTKDNGVGTGKTTEELCVGLSDLGFDDTIWEKGSCTVSAVDSDGIITIQYTLPYLKKLGAESVSGTMKIFNFGTDAEEEWLSCIQIYTAEELQAINKKLLHNYVLMNDITLEEGENNFTAIGTKYSPFSGYFSGNGHVVSGININKPDESIQGLFVKSDGLIKDVGVINSSIKAYQIVGGICGYNDGGTISGCYYTDSVIDCYISQTLSRDSYIGGICGYNSGTISDCYNTGTVSGSSDSYTGGVCGYNSSGTISDCYNTGIVRGSINSYVGSVCGKNSGGTVENCYYNSSICTIDNGIGTGKTTEELCVEASTLGFDDTIWENGSCTISEPDSDGIYDVRYTMPYHKFDTEPFGLTIKMYNFGTDSDKIMRPVTLIHTAEELQNIRLNLNQNYVLTNDITLEAGENNFIAIGTADAPFIGYFSGNGHVVSGININCKKYNQGLFGYSEGVIKDVGVINSSVIGYGNVGGVCGDNVGTISGCYYSGTVSGTNNVGGVCGAKVGTISGCYNTGTVSGTDSRVGGVCGYMSSGTISNCYNTGTVSGTDSRVGGVCGYNERGTVNNCYYNKYFCTKDNGIGTGKTTEELCVELSALGFDDTVWGKGSCTVSKINSTGVFSIQYTLPYLKKFGAKSVSGTMYIFNFGTDTEEKWMSCTPIYYSSQLQDINEELDQNYVLMRDIYFYTAGDNIFTAIGTKDTPFTGYFSGNGHVVSGIKISCSNGYKGLFGYSEGVIKDVGVINSVIDSNEYVGGVCGYNHGGTISGCYYTGTVRGLSNYFGGVCGYNDGGTISGCYNTGSVRGKNDVGGVCGYNKGGTISNCYNEGTVSGTSSYVGGVCGYNGNDGLCYGTISDCYNTGTVSGTSSYVGGVCGLNYAGPISNCYNTNSVRGTSSVGGVCGYNQVDTISDCYNTGTVSGTSEVGGVCGINHGEIIGGYNAGSVIGTGKYVGGVFGQNQCGTVENCCYNKDFCSFSGVNDYGVIKNAKGLTTTQMTSKYALMVMGLDSSVWSKKDNDKTAQTAYYPGLIASEYVPAINYSTKLDIAVFDNSDTTNKIIRSLGVSALVKFEGMDDFAADDYALTSGKGIFTIAMGDKNIINDVEIFDNTVKSVVVDSSYWSYATKEFTLEYNGVDSDFLPDTASVYIRIEGDEAITGMKVTNTAVVVSYQFDDFTRTEDFAFADVTVDMIEWMKINDIQLIIDFVNYSTAGSDTIILTPAQLKAIEYVLEYDLGKSA